MKFRGLFIAAFTLAFLAPPAQADDVTVTLDVAFSSAAPGASGDWQLFSRVDDTGSGPDGSFGISAIHALLTDIDFGNNGDAITILPGIGAILIGGQPPVQDLGGGVIGVVYGQNISDGPSVVPHVGNNGDQLIAYGTFSAGDVPGFGQDGSLFTAALFLNTDTPPFGAAMDPGATNTVVTQRVVPEPSSLAILLLGSLVGTMHRRSRG